MMAFVELVYIYSNIPLPTPITENVCEQYCPITHRIVMMDMDLKTLTICGITFWSSRYWAMYQGPIVFQT